MEIKKYKNPWAYFQAKIFGRVSKTNNCNPDPNGHFPFPVSRRPLNFLSRCGQTIETNEFLSIFSTPRERVGKIDKLRDILSLHCDALGRAAWL